MWVEIDVKTLRAALNQVSTKRVAIQAAPLKGSPVVRILPVGDLHAQAQVLMGTEYVEYRA